MRSQRCENRKNGNIGQKSRANRTVLLRVAEYLDGAFEGVHCSIPLLFEVDYVRDEDFLAPGVVGIADGLLLSRQEEVKIFGRAVAWRRILIT